MPTEAPEADEQKHKSAAQTAEEQEVEDEVDDDPAMAKLRLALDGLRAQRAELREAHTELAALQEQLLKAQGDAEVNRVAKDSAREILEEERKTSKKFQADLERERKSRTSLSTDVERLQSQLGSIGGGLKKLQARFTAASAELEEAKQAKASLQSEVASLKSRLQEEVKKQAELKEVEARLHATKSELQEQHALASNFQKQLGEQQKVVESSTSQVAALQSQVLAAREELAVGRQASMRLLLDLRTEMEEQMKAAWHKSWQELNQAPHRMQCTRPSALRPARTCHKTQTDAPRISTRVGFAFGEAFVSTLAVESFRDLGDELWVPQPESSVECDRCESRGPQSMGRMRRMHGISQFMLEEFLCADCARHEALDGKRNDAMANFLLPLPLPSPPHRTVQEDEGSSGSEESYSSSGVPRSSSSGALRRISSSGSIRRVHSLDVLDGRGKRRKT